MRIVLASSSAYRKKILKKLCLKFEVIPSSFDEHSIRLKKPSALVKRLSFEKAREVFERIKSRSGVDLVVLGADSVAYLAGEIIEKPRDKKDAVRILMRLSGKKHFFYSGATVIKRTGGKKTVFTTYDKDEVYFRKLTKSEIEKFVKSEPVEIWAGAYNFSVDRKKGYGFITKIVGDEHVVGGLPVEKLRNKFLIC